MPNHFPLPSDRDPAPLVGREHERALLDERLRATLDGQGSLVLVSGEAGIGKTTLVANLARQAEAAGALVLWGHCYDLSITPPYGPWLELAGHYQPGAGLPPAPAFLHDPAALAAAGSQEALFAQTWAFFAALAAARPLVLVLEDLHWADQESLTLLRLVARRLAGHRVLVLATYRSDDLSRRHALYPLIPLLVREAQAARLELQRLTDADRRALITQRYGLPETDATRLVAYLRVHAEGNPLYAGELLRTLEETRVLVRAEHDWRLGDLGPIRVPPLLLQVVEGRLSRLDDETRRLLQVAAIIGQEVPLALWQRVSEACDAALSAAIEQGQEAALLEGSPQVAGYRFRHALLRAALYEEQTIPLRRRRHCRVAELLAAARTPDADAVARHFQQAGDVRAVAWLLESARRARMTFATATALDRLETAIALDEQHDDASGLRGWLLAALASWSTHLPDVEQHVRMFEEASDIASRTNDEALAGLVEWSRAYLESQWFASVTEQMGRARDRIHQLPAAERARLFGFLYGAVGSALDPGGPDLASVVIGFQGQSGQYRETLAAVERIHADYPVLPPVAEMNIDNALMASYQALGRPEAALQRYDRMLAAHGRDHITNWAAVVLWLKLRDLVLVYWPDRIDMRRALADETVAAVRRAKSDQTFGPDMPDEIGIIWLLLVEGRWDEVRRVARQATAGGRYAAFLAAAPSMILSREQGDPEAAQAGLSLVFPEGPASEPGRTTFETSVACMHAAIEIALDAGDLLLARRWLECHDRWIGWSGSIPFTTIGHRLWARYHRLAGDQAAARARARRALALASQPRQPLALLAAQRLSGELDTEQGEYDRAHRHLTDALSLASACEAPFERALTLVAAAQLEFERGDAEAARPLLADARAICEPLTAKPTLERVAALEAQLAAPPGRQGRARGPAGLTRREVEVLRLVAQGLSDAEVAERLYISHRTVSTHLTSIYTKLGVNSRTAAARLAIERGLG